MNKPEYFLIVVGGRDFNDREYMTREILSLVWKELANFQVVIIQGEARGADLLAKSVAQALGLRCVPCSAEWEKFGKAAGPIRNKFMADYAHGLLAFHDHESKGTENMIQTMKKLNKSTRVRYY